MSELDQIPKDMVSTKDAAKILGLSFHTLNQYRTHGTGPKFVKYGRIVRYRLSDLQTWLWERSAKTAVL